MDFRHGKECCARKNEYIDALNRVGEEPGLCFSGE